MVLLYNVALKHLNKKEKKSKVGFRWLFFSFLLFLWIIEKLVSTEKNFCVMDASRGLLVKHTLSLSKAAKSNFQTSCTRNFSSDKIKTRWKGTLQVCLACLPWCFTFVYDIWNVPWVGLISVRRRGEKKKDKCLGDTVSTKVVQC